MLLIDLPKKDDFSQIAKKEAAQQTQLKINFHPREKWLKVFCLHHKKNGKKLKTDEQILISSNTSAG
jgi:hypothetical protein